MIDKFQRAEMFATFSQQPILFIKDPFEDGQDYWFVVYNFKEANPSNHIHVNELVEGKLINVIMNANVEYDQVQFLTKLDMIGKSRVIFPNTIKWLKIR